MRYVVNVAVQVRMDRNRAAWLSCSFESEREAPEETTQRFFTCTPVSAITRVVEWRWMILTYHCLVLLRQLVGTRLVFRLLEEVLTLLGRLRDV